ncbi:MAG TPA: YkvA family protein [Pyrinomonadaceae bacterium]|nr:YkvA family protein [Pyrinomonadaceae bacterium]
MSRKTDGKIKVKRSEKRAMRGRMGSFLMFLPNLARLLGRLLKDVRVPTAEKALFVAAIVYFVMPVDLIPDIFPFIGQVDDIYVIALTLLRLVNRTDERIVREHWSGGGDIVSLADSIANIAPMFLPKRVARVLSSRVELAPAGKVMRSITNRDEPLVREIPVLDDDELSAVDARSSVTN